MDELQVASKVRQAGRVGIQDVSADRNISIIDWHGVHARLRLSRREADIVGFFLRDLPERDIACRLEISVHTVHSHVERLYRKLHVRSRSALLLRMFDEWIELGMPCIEQSMASRMTQKIPE
jgi:DNA-binding CsgD family transcriptional regulator